LVTRLRKFNRSKGLKATAFLLAVVFITAIVLHVVYIYYRNYDLEPLFEEEYTKSKEFLNDELTPVIDEMYDYLATVLSRTRNFIIITFLPTKLTPTIIFHWMNFKNLNINMKF